MRKYWIIGGGLLLIILVFNLVELNAPPIATPADPVYVQNILASRKLKDEFLRSDTASPLLPLDKLNFVGLTYFEINPSLRLEATFQALPAVPNEKPQGKVRFSFQGKPFELLAFVQQREGRPSLFIPFRDPSNGKETYPGGRYLEVPILDAKTAVLDFNLSYHPYCAYNPVWVCPAVPPQNKLPFKVSAGEMGYAKSKDVL